MVSKLEISDSVRSIFIWVMIVVIIVGWVISCGGSYIGDGMIIGGCGLLALMQIFTETK